MRGFMWIYFDRHETVSTEFNREDKRGTPYALLRAQTKEWVARYRSVFKFSAVI
jgi:hypothetical protein